MTGSAFIDLWQRLEFFSRDASILSSSVHGLLEIFDSGEQLLLAILQVFQGPPGVLPRGKDRKDNIHREMTKIRRKGFRCKRIKEKTEQKIGRENTINNGHTFHRTKYINHVRQIIYPPWAKVAMQCFIHRKLAIEKSCQDMKHTSSYQFQQQLSIMRPTSI